MDFGVEVSSPTVNSTFADHCESLAKMGVMGLLSGAIAGAIAGGGGSRLAMRILAALNASKSGAMTENGFISGEITLRGTVGLIIFTGVFLGIIGGFVYVLLRRWIPGSGVWKGLAFGLTLFLLFGWAVIEKDTVDFQIFGPKVLGVALFALLFPLYGVLVSPIADRLSDYIPPMFSKPLPTRIGYGVLAAGCASGLFVTAKAVNTIF